MNILKQKFLLLFFRHKQSLTKVLCLLTLFSLAVSTANGADSGSQGMTPKVISTPVSVSLTPLFQELTTPAVKSTLILQDRQVVRSRPVSITQGLLNEGADLAVRPVVQKKSLSLNLFDNVSFIADLERVDLNAQGATWVGTLRGIDQSQVVIVVTGAIVAGNITMPEGRYHIRYAGEGVHEIQKINSSFFPKDEPLMPAPLLNSPKSTLTAPSTNAQTDDGSFIDVMVVYSATTRAAAGGTLAMQALVNLGFAETNQSYQNSDINQRIRLVHVEEVAYKETGSILDALQCITDPNDGCLDNIHALRNTYRADLVSFWVEEGDYCGIANMMNTVSASFESQGFSAVSRGCATGYYSFGHEMGHNMGATHDAYVDSGNMPYSYAHGYVYSAATSPWRTIMAYDDACQDIGKSCTRLQYWSNPTILQNGIAMGNAHADNHQTLNNTAKIVANFRSSVVIPACTITLSSTNLSAATNATTGSVTVTTTATGNSCAWLATSNASWISIVSGTSGSGNGNVGYAVLANTGSASRIGTLNIAGQTFTITQAGSTVPCPATPLTTNRVLTGSLSSSDCVDSNANGELYYYDLFVFSGYSGQRLSLSASSSQFDPDLLLIAPDGTTIYNDNGGGGTSPAIAATLSQTGNYQIWLSSSIASQTGSYSFSFALNMAISDLPDLIVSNVSVGAQAQTGGVVFISCVVKNQGLSAAPASGAGFYLSTHNAVTLSDIDTKFGCPIPALAAGASYSGCSGNITLPASVVPGTYYLGAFADRDNVIPESNETNNGLSSLTTVQVSTPSVIEFYNTTLDNYFITADDSEAAAIDHGSAGAGWSRTGNSFKVGGNASVCRFYGSQSPGPNSHFYTVDTTECNNLTALWSTISATQPRWKYEGMAFKSTPAIAEACPSNTLPIYRAYNRGFARHIDSNHRITSSLTAIQQVVARGWSNEGVVMCAPL